MHKILKYQVPAGSFPSFNSSGFGMQNSNIGGFGAQNFNSNSFGMTGFQPTPMAQFTPTTTAGKLYQGQLSVKNSSKQFTENINNMMAGMYGGSTNPAASSTATQNPGGSPNGTTGSGFSLSAGAGSAIGSGLDSINNAILSNSRYAKDPQANSQANVRSGISNAMIQSGNPYVMAAGLVTKVVDGALDATGMRSDNISKKAAEKAGVSGVARFANNLQNYLPGNPMAMGGAAISDSEKSMETEKVRGAFAGTLDDIDTAQDMGGSRVNFLLGGARNKMDKYVKEQNRRNEILTDISRTNTLRKQSDFSNELNAQNFNRYNGNTYQNTAVGKEGLKLPDKEFLNKIYSLQHKDDTQVLKDGGVIGVDSSVIPEGALHKELNHMEEFNEELDKVITDKGIAVVVTDEKGKVEQVAEIEKEEIVFRLALTKKIEELWHNGSEEAMIKAGKLIAQEIVKNTDDNTGDFLDGDNQN